ncbi:MAG: CotH kinase family protein [Prevotella sp.]|nr:CotH kinase family protein [Prevotella sp.]
MTRKSIVTLLFILTFHCANAQLIINEIMQSNIDCIMDDMNEFPDSWVELYNASSSACNLSEYKIGDEEDATKAWQLPAKSIGAHAYVVVFCDKEGTGLHTSFRLDSGKGGAIYLFKGGQIIDQVTDIKKQPAPNIAYGRKTDASEEWGYQHTPTPGATNCGKVIKKVLAEPLFSLAGGVYAASNGSRTLTLSIPDDAPQGTVIRYTTDGTEPTTSSSLYSAPLSISSTKVIRAKLFCDGYLSPRSTTQSYIYHTRAVTLPVISLVTDNKYFYDSKIGIYVDGKYSSAKKNYEYDWRRPLNVELFEGEGKESVINQLCETRVQGGQSRTSQLKSLTLYANKRFGEKRFDYEFFPDQKPGLTDYKSVILRNGGNDFDYLYMRDAIIQRNMGENVDIDWQAWRPAIIYLNGTYMGMLNIRERSTDDYVYTNYDGLEDFDMFENWYELKSGDWNTYNDFKTFYSQKGHTKAEYAERMDVTEFLNLMIMNLYYCNLDFPGNNIVMWRPNTDEGKWRWIAKDTDFGLGLYGRPVGYNTIQWIYNNKYDPANNWGNTEQATVLFRYMMEDKEIKDEFLTRCAVYMGTFMNYGELWKMWEPMYNMIKTEYPYHRKLINQWWPNYNEELENAKRWARDRGGYFLNMLKGYYSLGTITNIKLNTELSAQDCQTVDILFNGVRVNGSSINGQYFAGREVHLEGLPNGSGKMVTGWIMTTEGKSESIQGTQCTFMMPSSEISIQAVIGTDTGIREVPRSNNSSDAIYNLQGQKIGKHFLPRHGNIIIKSGRKYITP